HGCAVGTVPRVGVAKHSAVDGVQHIECGASRQLNPRRYDAEFASLLRAGRLDVGDPRGIEAFVFAVIELFHIGHCRSPSTCPLLLPLLMSILRVTLSGRGRASSIDKSPFASSAPVTSIPSARTNAR